MKEYYYYYYNYILNKLIFIIIIIIIIIQNQINQEFGDDNYKQPYIHITIII